MLCQSQGEKIRVYVLWLNSCQRCLKLQHSSVFLFIDDICCSENMQQSAKSNIIATVYQNLVTFLWEITDRFFFFTLCIELGFPPGKESACNAADLDSIPGWEDPLEQGMATHSSILAWRIPLAEEPGKLQTMGSQRVGSVDMSLSKLQEIVKNREAWHSMAHGVTKNQT